MSEGGPAYTVLFHRDGDVDSKSYRVPVWAFRTMVFAGASLAALVLLATILYTPLLRAAARVPRLQGEVVRLRQENERVAQLSTALDSLERQYQKIRRMLGADSSPEPPVTTDLADAPPIRVSDSVPLSGPDGPTLPSRWPLDEPGYVTRGQLGAGGEGHPGLDVAVRIGSLVRAAGGGTVESAGSDSTYGLSVVIRHLQGYETRYGHLSRIIAVVGDTVRSGEVIGLSGNSGRSTAPHLHFEIRRNGTSIDPRTMVKEGP